METVNRIQSVRDRVAAWRREGLGVAFVPTMGNLHRGHASLITLGRERAERVVVSVFVNPLQFGPSEDFNRYPRTLEHDTEILDKVGADLLFAPPALEMYPLGVERTAVIDVPELSGMLEGQFRPGHFAGVCTVVAKLFNIVRPDVALFGEKDFQQLVVIRRMVGDLCLPIEVVGAPIVRDPDGLALSSRNQYMTPHERERAPRLQESLQHARQHLLDGSRKWSEIEAHGLRELGRAGFTPDYFSIRRVADLQPPRTGDTELVILTAARFPTVRLIDNVQVSLAGR